MCHNCTLFLSFTYYFPLIESTLLLFCILLGNRKASHHLGITTTLLVNSTIWQRDYDALVDVLLQRELIALCNPHYIAIVVVLQVRKTHCQQSRKLDRNIAVIQASVALYNYATRDYNINIEFRVGAVDAGVDLAVTPLDFVRLHLAEESVVNLEVEGVQTTRQRHIVDRKLVVCHCSYSHISVISVQMYYKKAKCAKFSHESCYICNK